MTRNIWGEKKKTRNIVTILLFLHFFRVKK